MTTHRILSAALMVVLLAVAAIGRVMRSPSRLRPGRSIWDICSGDAITFREALKILAILAIAYAFAIGIFTVEGYFFQLHD